jgi:asparagine synthase (glutamine-hydrolysing)
MCGIAGIIDVRFEAPIGREPLERMALALVHRGPDSDGFHLGRGVGLAFRRLSIIDVAGGDQPILARDERGETLAAIVFNGEIYNHHELRAELEGRGRVFATHSDTEAILLGYLEWGERELLSRLRGMYAFAIHDAKRRRVVLARDPLGKKPLYLARRGDRLAFASEIKALLTDRETSRELSSRALLDYATLGYTLRDEPIFAATERLLPGHYMVIEDGSVRRERHYAPSFQRTALAYPAAVARLEELVAESVAIRLESEVPLGCFLSGGVDSSLIAARMVDRIGTSLAAVTIGFDERGFDEREAARQVARHLGIATQEELVRPDPSALDDLANTFDEPLADPSAVPTLLLCRAARRRVTVALSGDGGDECFGGYRRYRFDLAENRVRDLLPAAVRKRVLAPLSAAWPKADYLPRPLRFKATLENLARDPVEAYFRSLSRIRPTDAFALLAPERRREVGDYRTLERFRDLDRARSSFDPLARIRALDFETWLPDDILVKVDRASMAASLEVRAPLLDSRLVEFASTLPSDFLVSGSGGKRILKDVARRSLPAAILERKKHGFDLPVAAWLDGPLRGELDALVAPRSPLAGHFDLDVAKVLLEEHRGKRRDRGAELWTLVAFGRFASRWLPAR